MFAKEKYCSPSHELNHNKGCFVGCGKSVDVLEKCIICCSNVHDICIQWCTQEFCSEEGKFNKFS
jgi:hypothetical protein